MTPPDGYAALGDVFVTGHAQPVPSGLPYRCVRSDLAGPGRVGSRIYDDRGSGANADLSVWAIVVQAGPVNTIPIGGFVGNNQYAAPYVAGPRADLGPT